jgi:hypothetical protein
MGDTILIVVVFGGFTATIWLSYKFFMRGSTDADKVAALKPEGFKPDWEYRMGDTYVGFEGASSRLVLVDWPHGKSITPGDVVSVEKVDESIWGLKHRWVVVGVQDPKVPRYRLWFRFNASARDEWLAKIAALKGSA